MQAKKMILMLTVLAWALSGPAGPAQAQETKPTAKPVTQLDDTVVTATGQASSAFDTPVAMNVITADDLAERGAISMADVFQGQPGLSASITGPNSVRPMIRGLYDERVLVLVNGVRLSEQRPGGSHILSLDPAQIQRVEVVRGPASVLYGSDAIGGVINIITKQPPRETGPEARAGGRLATTAVSNPAGWRMGGEVTFGQGAFNGLVGGFYRDQDNLETPDYELKHSAYEGGMAWGAANYRGPSWQAEFNYYYMQADLGIPAPEVFFSDQFKDEKEHFLAGKLAYDAGAAWADRMEFTLGAQRHERHRQRVRTSTNPAVILGNLQVDIMLDIDTYSFKPVFFKKLGPSHQLTYGLDAFHEDASSDRTMQDTGSNWVNPGFNHVPVIPDSQRQGWGLFLQDQFTIAPRWVLTAGLRYDWIESSTDGHPRHDISSPTSQDDGALSGSLGLLYKASPAVNLYANLGRAFRAPTLLERYFYGPHDSAKNDVGDPDLAAETSWNLDLGLKFRTSRLGGEVSLFYNQIDDYIVKLDTGDEYTWTNLDQAVLYGGELSLDWRLSPGLSALASASYVIGKNEKTDQDLPSVPPLSGKAGLRYERPLGQGRAWAELSMLWATKQTQVAPGERETSGWTRVDLRAGYALGKDLKLILAAQNLGDRQYYDHLSRTWQDLGLSDQIGRSFLVTLEWGF